MKVWFGLGVVVAVIMCGCGSGKQAASYSPPAQSASMSESTPPLGSYAEGDVANRVKAAVASELMSNSLQPRDFTVADVDGVVTLRGTVDSYAVKRTIESTARDVRGVKQVKSLLIVGIASLHS